MAYRDDQDKIIEKTIDEINCLNHEAFEDSVIITIKSANVGNGNETFYDDGWEAMGNCVNYIDDQYKDFSSYRGVGYYKLVSTWELYQNR